MPERLFSYCRERGCGKQTNDRSGYCEAHILDNSYMRSRAERDANRKKNDPTWPLYNRVAWKRFHDAFFGHGNSVCQRIEYDGVRCRRPVEILHHILSPRSRPDLFFTPSNVVGVCRQHHPNSEGEPKENLARLSKIYVPTLWPDFHF